MVFTFLGGSEEYVCGFIQMFRDTVSLPSSGVEMSKKSECPKYTATKAYSLACAVRLHWRKYFVYDTVKIYSLYETAILWESYK
jgi:hypothetical protein